MPEGPGREHGADAHVSKLWPGIVSSEIHEVERVRLFLRSWHILRARGLVYVSLLELAAAKLDEKFMNKVSSRSRASLSVCLSASLSLSLSYNEISLLQ